MLMERAKEYRALRAPAGDGETLIDPAWSTLADVTARNREQLSYVQYDLQGRSLGDLTAAARRALLDRAVDFTTQYREIPNHWRSFTSLAGAPFLLSGHQPELFHPGVWYKNFVLGSLARRLSGVGIHLLIDSDMCRSVSIRVPAGAVDRPHVEAVAYDGPAAEVPYEERVIDDMPTFSTFAERTTSLIRPLVADPIVAELWPLMMERNRRQKNLGLRLAQGRHALEETWHNETLELPQSAVCQLPEFAWFVAHLLANLPRFWAAHNDALRDIGAHTGCATVRSLCPIWMRPTVGWKRLWIWSCDDPKRRPLYVRQSGDGLTITDRHKFATSLSLTDDGEAASAAGQLFELSARGVKLRTRALTTTLFARLVLSDLFLHGIGGAKYDQVTDEIVRLFFGFEPPQFATVSATLRLPIMHQSIDASLAGQWEQRLRELRYHPEHFVETNGDASNDASAATKLIAAKRRWVESIKTHEKCARTTSGDCGRERWPSTVRGPVARAD